MWNQRILDVFEKRRTIGLSPFRLFSLIFSHFLFGHGDGKVKTKTDVWEVKTEEPHITCCLRAPETGSRTFFKLTRGEVSDSQPSNSQMFAIFVKTDETFKKF